MQNPLTRENFSIDHIIPEELYLKQDKKEYEKWEKKFRLPPAFDIEGYENFILCDKQFNIDKGTNGLENDGGYESNIRAAIPKAAHNKKKIEDRIEKIKDRKRRIISMSRLKTEIKDGKLDLGEIIEDSLLNVDYPISKLVNLISSGKIINLNGPENEIIRRYHEKFTEFIQEEFPIIKKRYFPFGAGIGISYEPTSKISDKKYIGICFFPLKQNGQSKFYNIKGENWKKLPSIGLSSVYEYGDSQHLFSNPEKQAILKALQFLRKIFSSYQLNHTDTKICIDFLFLILDKMRPFQNDLQHEINLTKLKNWAKKTFPQPYNTYFDIDPRSIYDSNPTPAIRIFESIEFLLNNGIDTINRNFSKNLPQKNQYTNDNELGSWLMGYFRQFFKSYQNILASNFPKYRKEFPFLKPNIDVFIEFNQNLRTTYGSIGTCGLGSKYTINIFYGKEGGEELTIQCEENSETKINNQYKWENDQIIFRGNNYTGVQGGSFNSLFFSLYNYDPLLIKSIYEELWENIENYFEKSLKLDFMEFRSSMMF